MEYLYKKKFIILIVIALVVIACLKGESKKQIPCPIIKADQDLVCTQGNILSIQGNGFIANYPEVHKVVIIDNHYKKPRYKKLSVLAASLDNLKILIPANMNFGDYDLGLKLETKLLASKASISKSAIKVRPRAASRPKLEYQVLSNYNELNSLLETKFVNGNELIQAINGDLITGVNQIYQYYFRDGYQSIKSQSESFYYLPENQVESELKIKSESPLNSFAIDIQDQLPREIDVSRVTSEEITELAKSFFLRSKNNPRYLEYSVKLSPVYIQKVHALEEEYAILTNRSSNSFVLSNCSLADSIQSRYKFSDKDSIPAKQSMTIIQNLGLNNSSPDLLKLLCLDSSKTNITIDEFRYEKIDADGFAIKI